VHLITLREILRDADVTHAISLVVREHNLSEEQTEQALITLHVPRPAKPRLEQSWDKVIFLTGVDYFSTFRKRAQQFRRRRSALRPQRVNSRPFRIYEIGYER